MYKEIFDLFHAIRLCAIRDQNCFPIRNIKLSTPLIKTVCLQYISEEQNPSSKLDTFKFIILYENQSWRAYFRPHFPQIDEFDPSGEFM